MERKTQSGYLVLADISGYTSFVARTEIEHADIALSYLLETIVENLGVLLTISKLEGDAVFAYVEESKLHEGKSLLDLVDHTYIAFRDKAQALYAGSTCGCRACQTVPTLDLKFILHHGDFVIQQVAGIKDLLGTDVNLIHRLSKNHISESTGWRDMRSSRIKSWSGYKPIERISTSNPNPMNTWEMSKHTASTCTPATTRSGILSSSSLPVKIKPRHPARFFVSLSWLFESENGLSPT